MFTPPPCLAVNIIKPTVFNHFKIGMRLRCSAKARRILCWSVEEWETELGSTFSLLSMRSLFPSTTMLPSLFSSGQPRHSHQWSAEAFTPMGIRGIHTSGQPRHPFLAASGQPRHSHPWAAEEFTPMAPVLCFQCLASSVLLSLQWHQWTAEAPVSCFQCANEVFTRVRSVGIHSNGNCTAK